MQIPEDWMASEKGNTWLCDDDGNHVAWLKMGERLVEISVTPGNSPGLWARLLPEDEGEEQIVKHINVNLQGWTVRRCNFNGVEVGSDNMVGT
jgi:hypothetical protein